MTDTLTDTAFTGERIHRVLARPSALIVATDGTPQSDAAVSLGYLLSMNNAAEAMAITVVDRAPVPWGNIDRSIVMEYERGLHEEARDKARAQVDRLGDQRWTVEVLTGDPASTIAARASEARARMVIVGLGGHGAAARFFGNETALRLIRASHTPVLAVDTKLRTLPKRVMVAMDFSESSIEAARLALEIAAPGANVTLVHVVPWERKDYIPENWFREHEAYVGGQLKRVIGWLDRPGGAPIHHEVLYGKPGPSLLAYAEKLDADLIVAGTHGRGLLGRMMGGETVAKLVRGARRSVLIFPAAAAFQRFDEPDKHEEATVTHADWSQTLDDFTRRNSGRLGRLEVDDPAVGAQVEMTGYRFLGAVYDAPSRRAQLMFGTSENLGPHLVRGISNVKSINVLANEADGGDSTLSVVSDTGQTLLFFDGVKEAY